MCSGWGGRNISSLYRLPFCCKGKSCPGAGYYESPKATPTTAARFLEENGYGMSTSPTLDQLRADIDSGRTGDKVAAPDPAMASLGTDDEAAGTPPSSDAIALTQRLETSRPDEAGPQTGLGHAWILVAVVVMFASALICWGLFLKAF